MVVNYELPCVVWLSWLGTVTTARRTTTTLPHGFNSIRDRAVHCSSSRPFSLYDYLDGRRTYDILITCRLVLPPNGLTVRSIRLVTVKIKYKKHENILHNASFFVLVLDCLYFILVHTLKKGETKPYCEMSGSITS